MENARFSKTFRLAGGWRAGGVFKVGPLMDDILSICLLVTVLLSSLLISKRAFAAMKDKSRGAAWGVALFFFVASFFAISFALTFALFFAGVFHR
jgi:hypothetical protein